MSKSIYFNGVKAKGCYHNGIKYLFTGSKTTKIRTSGTWTARYAESITVSSSSTASGSLVYTPTVNTSTTFSLYKYPDLQALTSLPNDYRFVFKDGSTTTQIASLSLVYDGNGLFHLSGNLDGIYGYAKETEGKYGSNYTYGNPIITLEDSSGKLYYLNKQLPISVTRTEDTSSHTFNTNTSTITYYSPDPTGIETIDRTINLPVSWNSSSYGVTHTFNTFNYACATIGSTSVSIGSPTLTGSGSMSNITYTFIVE